MGGMMIRCSAVLVAGMAILAGAGQAHAQDWTGFYVSGSAGGAFQKQKPSETVRFDTNLDGAFVDTVRTAGGADAFSPGFCGGLTMNATAAAGCSKDEGGIDFGGRLGYDRQVGSLVLGAVVEMSRTDVTDSATAFSITPAFYSFTRQLDYVAGFRGRAGFGNNRFLVYGTGGTAWGSVEQQFTTSNAVNTFVRSGDAMDDDDDEGTSGGAWGYQAGGGVEVRLGVRWSMTGEYLFTSLDDREDSTIRSQGPAPATNPFILVNAAGTDLRRSEKFEFQNVRVGLSYRF